MATDSLDSRLREVERALEQLQQRVDRLADPNRHWWAEDAGRFAHDPVFDEIVRLGRQYRQSQKSQDASQRDRS